MSADHPWTQCRPCVRATGPVPVMAEHQMRAFLDEMAHTLDLAIHHVWERTSDAERQAFHRAACENSADAADHRIAEDLMCRVAAAANALTASAPFPRPDLMPPV